MTTNVIQLSPSNKIKTAIILMKGHNISGLPVVEDERIVGVVDYQAILGKDNDIAVQSVMDREFVTVPSGFSVNDAADLMSKINSNRLLIVDDGALTGVVTHGDLLPELGKSFDPITGLARADAMRDWGITALKSGREITLLFLDLDQFGQFNKKYGHIIGDKVLQHVANVLLTFVDEERDMLCRYAGDEFVIVTMRDAEEANELALAIEQALSNTPNPELPEPVTGSIGVRGGKRSKEREDTHYNATLDNLINLASKACTMAKKDRLLVESIEGEAPETTVEEPEDVEVQQFVEESIQQFEVTPPNQGSESAEISNTMELFQVSCDRSGKERLIIESLNFSWNGDSIATAEIELNDGSNSFRASRTGVAIGPNGLRLVADATANAVCEFLPHPGYSLVAENLQVVKSSGIDTVVATVLLLTPKSHIRLSGSAIIRHDGYRAVASAVLDAINRPLSAII
jgi:diguanylate cyclase (GGDEF)-like protein